MKPSQYYVESGLALLERSGSLAPFNTKSFHDTHNALRAFYPDHSLTMFPHGVPSRRSPHNIVLTMFTTIHQRFPFCQYHNRLLKDLFAPSSSVNSTSTLHQHNFRLPQCAFPFCIVQYLLPHNNSYHYVPAFINTFPYASCSNRAAPHLMYLAALHALGLVPHPDRVKSLFQGVAKITTNILHRISMRLCKYNGSFLLTVDDIPGCTG